MLRYWMSISREGGGGRRKEGAPIRWGSRVCNRLGRVEQAEQRAQQQEHCHFLYSRQRLRMVKQEAARAVRSLKPFSPRTASMGGRKMGNGGTVERGEGTGRAAASPADTQRGPILRSSSGASWPQMASPWAQPFPTCRWLVFSLRRPTFPMLRPSVSLPLSLPPALLRPASSRHEIFDFLFIQAPLGFGPPINRGAAHSRAACIEDPKAVPPNHCEGRTGPCRLSANADLLRSVTPSHIVPPATVSGRDHAFMSWLTLLKFLLLPALPALPALTLRGDVSSRAKTADRSRVNACVDSVRRQPAWLRSASSQNLS